MVRAHKVQESRLSSIVAGPDVDEALYQAAQEILLAAAVRPPGPLCRLRRTIWTALRALHAQRRTDGDSLPPEYWYMHC
jgi:hypothetical protein